MFAALIGHFGLELVPSQFYTRCTLCNGAFETVDAQQLEVERPPQLPSRLVGRAADDPGRPLSFFRCRDCRQLYWWGSKSTGAAEKFRSAAAAPQGTERCLTRRA